MHPPCAKSSRARKRISVAIALRGVRRDMRGLPLESLFRRGPAKVAKVAKLHFAPVPLALTALAGLAAVASPFDNAPDLTAESAVNHAGGSGNKRSVIAQYVDGTAGACLVADRVRAALVDIRQRDHRLTPTGE
jgi:hypothetical protein